MRRAGRLSSIAVVLAVLSLVFPGTALASKGQRANAKAKTVHQAQKSKEKMALQRAKQKQQGGPAKAAGFLPRPGGQKAAGEAPVLAQTRTAAVSRGSSAKQARPTRPVARKTRTARRTRRVNPARRTTRVARSQSRQSQAAAPDAAEAQAAAQMAELAPAGKPPSRLRRIASGVGRVLKGSAKFLGYGLVVAAPAAVMAIGGLPIAFAIGAPAIFLGIPMVIGLVEQAAKKSQGIDDPQQELLQRYMNRQMIENHDLNGPGPGNNVSGVGGLNSLNNMIDPGGMR